MTISTKGWTFRPIFTAGVLPVAVLMAGCASIWDPTATQDSEAFSGQWTNIGTVDGGSATSDSNTQTLRGYVHDPFGIALEGVEVETLDGVISHSDSAGQFALPEVEPGQQVVMTFYKPGYATTQGSVVATEDGVNFFSQTMAPVDLSMDFAADDGAEFEIDDTHSFTLPSQTILTEDGEAYDGIVHLEVTVWDRTKPLGEGGEFLASPGNGRGISFATAVEASQVFPDAVSDAELTVTGAGDYQQTAGNGILVDFFTDAGGTALAWDDANPSAPILELTAADWAAVNAQDFVDLVAGSAAEGNVVLASTGGASNFTAEPNAQYLADGAEGAGGTQGEEVLLYSFGMFQLEMTDDEGAPLQAGPGISISVDVPSNSNLQVGDTVPYWSYDPERETWLEEDAGRIVELAGGQQVWEFTPIQGLPLRNTTTQRRWRAVVTGNPDYPIITWVAYDVQVSATASGRVSTRQGDPLGGASVRVIASDQTYMIRTQTDAAGNFSVTVPPQVSNPVGPNGRSLFIEVDYEVAQQPKLWRQDPIPAPGIGGVADFGNVVAGSMTCLSGTVIDSTGAPVAGLNIATPHAGNALTDAEGSFCTSVPLWQPSTAYGVFAPGSPQGFEPVRFRPAPTGPVGICETSCPNVVELRQYESTSCASGLVVVGNQAVGGILVESFDNRFPNAPIFSARTSAGEYCVSIPVGLETTVRVGAGDNATGNSCASHSLRTTEAGETCDDGWCEEVPTFDCGQ